MVLKQNAMKAYKGFEVRDEGGLWCKDFQYEIGKTYKHKGDIKLCDSGFHACKTLQQVWQYYVNNGYNVFCEVECGGKIVESQYGDGKIVCSEITIVRQVDVSQYQRFYESAFYLNGYMRIRGRNGYNYIDKDGNLLSRHWFEDGLSMHNGWIAVSLRKKWNFINKQGRFLLKSGVDDVSSFANNMALLKDNNRYNLVDTQGNILFSEWQHGVRYHRASWEVEMDGAWIQIKN